MPTYKAPLRDMRFVLHELLGVEQLSRLPGYEEATADLVDSVLDEGARLAEEVLAPLNRGGDEEGCRFENGAVATPAGFRQAYDTFAAGGWTSLACDPDYGGQGLPQTVNLAFVEMICSANLSFGTYPGLSHGAYNALHLHGSDALKQLYLPKLVSGEWSGTMCLTEPQCGTDLGLIKTKAEPSGDGSYRISGTKIFISAGEHDLTDNILHLVLARLPDAPQGTRGISLFLVPKYLPKPDGTPGPRNGVACGGIETKMGIHGSATCVMNFDGATGWLVGRPNKGMSAMFTMMNTARLAVGIQGLGLAELAYQGARDYARERLQGRALAGPREPEKPADPIIVHPDVRRMLLTMRACNEAARALAYLVGMEIDISLRHPDPKRRQEADDFVALMTPIVKSFFTDYGFEAANLGVQVWGGHGYIRDNGMEQIVRDARIAQLYEGANGIQALDLVGRKMGQGTGRLLRRFFHPVSALLETESADPKMAELALPLMKAFARLQQSTAWLAQQGLKDPEEAGAAANDYLRFFALVALGFMWLRMARIATDRLDAGTNEPEFYQAKLAVAKFYMARILPQHSSLAAAMTSGKAPIMELAEAQY
ncbi:MAG: acyl-CoA dehydrogenase [Alphaproteobacteria bacterium]|nr:MAG: acyl-CoA dehydrogenase [Alphaproteobacteria bacterium]